MKFDTLIAVILFSLTIFAGMLTLTYWFKMPDNGAACVVSFKEVIYPIAILFIAIAFLSAGSMGLWIALKHSKDEFRCGTCNKMAPMASLKWGIYKNIPIGVCKKCAGGIK